MTSLKKFTLLLQAREIYILSRLCGIPLGMHLSVEKYSNATASRIPLGMHLSVENKNEVFPASR